MHEMSITRSMLGIVDREMKKNGLKRLKRLKVKVGELTAVEPEALRFCFEAATKGTAMEGASLDIETVPLTGRCASCGKNFKVEGFSGVCPSCGGKTVEKVTGTELDIVSIEAD